MFVCFVSLVSVIQSRRVIKYLVVHANPTAKDDAKTPTTTDVEMTDKEGVVATGGAADVKAPEPFAYSEED